MLVQSFSDLRKNNFEEVKMSLNESLELDFNDDSTRACFDTELVELSGSPLGEDLLSKSDQKQSEDRKEVSITESTEAIPRVATSEFKTISCVDDIEDGETIDSADCEDIEEGEIGGLPDSEFLNKFSCRFYQKGLCGWGKDCRFFHLSDKGLYSMFDAPIMQHRVAFHVNLMEDLSHQELPPVPLPPPLPPLPPPPPPPPPSEAFNAWDKYLMETKLLIEQSKTKKRDCFEEDKRYLTVDTCNDISVDKSAKSSRKDKITPQSVCKRLLNHYMPKNSESSKNKPKDAKLGSLRTDSMKKANYHSEWTDPWRRSKTPPRCKRSPSNFSTDSSKSSKSGRDLASTSESSSKCRTSDSTHVRRLSHKSRNISFRYKHSVHKKFSKKAGRRSSFSSSERSSHSSKRSSPSSFARKVRRRSNKRRSHFRSPSFRRSKRRKSSSRESVPYYRKRSRSISPTLPFHVVKKDSWEKTISIRRKSGSVSRPFSPLKTPQQTRAAEKHSEDFPEEPRCSRSVSPNNSRRFAIKPKTGPNSGDLSCSDMSISPLSDSSTESMRCSIKTTAPLPTSATTSKHDTYRDNTDVPYSSSVVRNNIQTKKLSALEVELFRYHPDSRPSPPPAAKSKVLDSPHSKDKKTAKGSNGAKKLKVSGTSQAYDKTVHSSGSAKKKTPKKLDPCNAPSKREMLIQKLKLLEEAIARKKKFTSH